MPPEFVPSKPPELNLCRLNVLAEWLEAGAPEAKGVDAFDIRVWNVERECGTVCCLAGAAVQWWGDPTNRPEEFGIFERGDQYITQGAEILGLSRQNANKLFTGFPGAHSGLNASPISPKCAARVVRHLIKTGKVDWSKA